MSAATARRATDVVFFATVFTVTFGQLKWGVGSVGRIRVFEALAVLFVAALVVERLLTRDRDVGRVEIMLAAFGVLLLLVYLGGVFALETDFSRTRFERGIATFAIHFSLLIAGVGYLARRPRRFYWLTLACFCAGMTANALYASVQLVAAKAGVNVDQELIAPLTGIPGRSLAYSLEAGPNVIRARGLATDPNHLGIMLLVPLLTLAPLLTRLPRPRLLGAVFAGLVVIEAATFSRSAVLGLGVGIVVIAVLDRRALLSHTLVFASASAAVLLLAIASQHTHFYKRVLTSRLNPHDHQLAAPGHFGLYSFVGRTLHTHPFFGVGLNDFAAFYSTRLDYSPLSFYVQSIVETGIVGSVVTAMFLVSVFLGLRRIYVAAHDDASALLRPLAVGLTAALAATMAANAFYQTMTFAYFYVFLVLVFAAPSLFAPTAPAPSTAIEPRQRAHALL